MTMNEYDVIKEKEIGKLLNQGKVVVIGEEKGAVVVRIDNR